jgi:hypothetical protein
MDEAKIKKIEDQLRKLIALQTQSQEENQPAAIPVGTRVIRRRKGTPDKHIK